MGDLIAFPDVKQQRSARRWIIDFCSRAALDEENAGAVTSEFLEKLAPALYSERPQTGGLAEEPLRRPNLSRCMACCSLSKPLQPS